MPWTLFCSLEQSRINIYLSYLWQILKSLPGLLFNCSLWDHYFSYSLPQTPTLVLGSSKAPYYWLLLLLCGFPSSECTHLWRSGVYTSNRAMWPLAHSEVKPLCSFHISQDFIVVYLSLLFDFWIFSYLLYQTIKQAAIQRHLKKITHNLPALSYQLLPFLFLCSPCPYKTYFTWLS